MRVAVTGAAGRLGRALIEALEDAPFTGPMGPIGWTRAELDLDTLTPGQARALLRRHRPELVIHAAAWTDVDGCARDPDRAHARNAVATAVLADACAEGGIDLAYVSTNEVFAGDRRDSRGYRTDDPPAPPNAYGASKLAGEQEARAAFTRATGAAPATGVAKATRATPPTAPRLAIVRTSWLFGPGAPDFPRKILAAAERARAEHRPLQAVADEWGTPTYVADLAEAVVELLAEDALTSPGEAVGVHHVVNSGLASRADWARDVLGRAGLDVPVLDVPATTWHRASTPPAWGVLEPTPLPSGGPMPSWQDAMARYAPTLLRGR